MAKSNNIVHQYYKKDFDDMTVLVRVNPILFTGTEITLLSNGAKELRELEFDENIEDDLKVDGFTTASPLEFNLHLMGLV
ncbi:MAG TPA: hypothetical protein VF141_17225 [Chryseolinea sp.]